MLLAAAGAVAIAALTLVPIPSEAGPASLTPWWCLVCGDLGAVDVFSNILLFIPLGAGLVLAGMRWRRVVLLCFVASLTIELLQATIITGRDASLSDVLTNTCGGLLGALVAGHWRAFVVPTPRSGARLALIGGLLWLGALAAGGWALQPVAGVAARVAVAPARPFLERFDGTLGHLTLDDRALTDGDTLPTPFPSPRYELGLGLTTGHLARRFAPILDLEDAAAEPLLRLGQQGPHLVVSIRGRGESLRLHSPALRLRFVLPMEPGHDVSIRVGGTRATLWAEVMQSGRTRTDTLRLTPVQAWTLVAPWGSLTAQQIFVWTVLSLLVVLGLVGYWAGIAGEALPAVGVIVLIGAGLGLLALLEGMAPTPWWGWVAAGAGGLGGWAAGRYVPPALHARGG